jgi:hypothetical protein
MESHDGLEELKLDQLCPDPVRFPSDSALVGPLSGKRISFGNGLI